MFYRLFKFTVVVIFAIAFLSELAHAAPPIEETGGPFFCQNGTSLTCCPLLAHRIASEHHSRCASIMLNNKSGYNIRLVVSSLEDGRWVTSDDSGDIDVDCSPRTDLANGESEVFSSVTSHFLGGIRGYATFIINDEVSTTFTIDWMAPLIGPNEHYVSGLPTENYHVALQYGFDHTVFQVTVAPVGGMPFFVLPLIGFIVICCVAAPKQNGALSERINSQPQRYHSCSTPEPSHSDYSKPQPSSSDYSTTSSNRSKLQPSSSNHSKQQTSSNCCSDCSCSNYSKQQHRQQQQQQQQQQPYSNYSPPCFKSPPPPYSE